MSWQTAWFESQSLVPFCTSSSIKVSSPLFKFFPTPMNIVIIQPIVISPPRLYKDGFSYCTSRCWIISIALHAFGLWQDPNKRVELTRQSLVTCWPKTSCMRLWRMNQAYRWIHHRQIDSVHCTQWRASVQIWSLSDLQSQLVGSLNVVRYEYWIRKDHRSAKSVHLVDWFPFWLTEQLTVVLIILAAIQLYNIHVETQCIHPTFHRWSS